MAQLTTIKRADGVVQRYLTGSVKAIPKPKSNTPSPHSAGATVTRWPEGDDSWRTPAKSLIPGFEENGLDPEGYDARGLGNGFDRSGLHTETGTKYDPRGFGEDGLNAAGVDSDGFDVNRQRVAPAYR